MKLILLPSVVVDVTGDTLLLLNRETSDVMAVSAEAVTYRAHPRAQIEIVEGGEILAEELRLRGFVSAVQPQDPVRVSRRSVVQGAAVVAGAGVVSLALPNAAFASSVVSLSGRWNWDVQAGDPPSRFDIYVSVAKSDIDLPGFDDSPWPPPMYYTIEVDLGGPKGTGGEYDGSGVTDVDWRWGAIGVANGDPGYDFLLPFHMGSPGTLEGVLKEAGKTIATLSLTYQAQLAGYVFCVRVGESEKPWFRFVATTEDWEPVVIDEKPAIDEEALTSLMAADPVRPETERDLSPLAYEKAFDAWQLARQHVFAKWNRLVDPANLQPDIPKAFRDAYAFVQANGKHLQPAELMSVLKKLNSVPSATVKLASRGVV